jgi:hypothetical protein
MSLPKTNAEEHMEWIKTIHFLRLMADINNNNNRLGRKHVEGRAQDVIDVVAAILVQRHEVIATAYTSSSSEVNAIAVSDFNGEVSLD